jgi:hypothetical protein
MTRIATRPGGATHPAPAAPAASPAFATDRGPEFETGPESKTGPALATNRGLESETGPESKTDPGSETGPASGTTPRRWLFSGPLDLALFGGTAVISLLLVLVGPSRSGSPDAPEWTWITGVLLVDVAHVWSTAFVVYLDPAERRRRSALYAITPLAAFAAGVALYARGEAVFWRALAYLAVFHFIRQQYGWVMMYRARGGERDRAGRWLDGATVYAATLYPLIVWHTQLPRGFWWMKQGDFVAGLPAVTATVAGWIYLALLAAYVLRAAGQSAPGPAAVAAAPHGVVRSSHPAASHRIGSRVRCELLDARLAEEVVCVDRTDRRRRHGTRLVEWCQ